MRLTGAGIALLAFLLPGGFAGTSPVLEISVDSVIEPVSVEIIERGLEQARSEGAALVILRLNTPGGLMDSMRSSIEKIVASPVPVVTFVAPSGGRAASAGFFLLEAGDIAAMAPGTNTGAAHPVLMGSQMDPVMKQKVENDAAASLRSLTAKRGRNSDLAQKAVLESKSFTDREALDGKLIELIARDERDLLTQLNGRTITRFNGSTAKLQVGGARIVEYQRTLRQRILVTMSDPNLALVLLAIGAVGIYAEFSAPGMILPGVAGAICALLGLSALSVFPISWLGASLLLLALLFFVLEVKFTSHGVLGIGAVISMVLGAMLLIDSPIPELRVRFSTAIGVALPFALITWFLLSIAVKARRNKVATGTSSMLGESGRAVEDLNPTGRVFVRGEYWNATSTAPVKSGERVRILSLQGLQVTVEPAHDKIGGA